MSVPLDMVTCECDVLKMLPTLGQIHAQKISPVTSLELFLRNGNKFEQNANVFLRQLYLIKHFTSMALTTQLLSFQNSAISATQHSHMANIIKRIPTKVQGNILAG